MVDNSETFEVCESKLNDYMEIYMYQRSKSFFDVCPRSLEWNWISGERYRTIGPLVSFVNNNKQE